MGLRPLYSQDIESKSPGMRANSTTVREATNQEEDMSEGPEVGMHRTQALGTFGSAATPSTKSVLYPACPPLVRHGGQRA